MTKPVNTRELILGILMEVTREGTHSHVAVRQVLEKYQYLEKKDRAFITRVTEGTLERMIELDYIINQFSKVKTNKMKPVIRNILRSAVYQMKYMDSVPDSAVCNEAVKLAERKGFYHLKKFVNGVLRTIQRNINQIVYPTEEENQLMALSVRYSMPEWIIAHWLEQYDDVIVKQILEAFLAEGTTTIRCNLAKITAEQLADLIQKEQIKVEVDEYLPYALHISGYDHLKKVPGYQEGFFQVQDVSSMLVGEAASPQRDNYCLDVCAAPGGKAIHLAERLKDTGRVEARDLTLYKTDMIRENAERAGLNNIIVREWDALQFDKEAVEQADILIIDVPCSGLGVMKKKTDIKYNMTPGMQNELVKLQRKIVDTVWPYVKKGGIMIYSTCTIHAAENIGNRDWILAHLPFEAVSLDAHIPANLHSSQTSKGYLQLLPGIHNTDGFFIAKFIRKNA